MSWKDPVEKQTAKDIADGYLELKDRVPELEKQIQHLQAENQRLTESHYDVAERASKEIEQLQEKVNFYAICNADEVIEQLQAENEAMRLIKLLTKDEVSSVTIHHPNPDFDLGRDYAIDYQPPAYPPQEVRYEGETLLECLQKAVEGLDQNGWI